MQRASCRQVHAQQVGKLNSCHPASVQCAHVSGSTNIAAPAPAKSAQATLVERVGAEACWCAKMLNRNSCWSSCWQSLGPTLFLRLREVRHRPCDDWTPAMDAEANRNSCWSSCWQSLGPTLFLRLRVVRHRPCDDWTPAMDAEAFCVQNSKAYLGLCG
jgi:hypothetical protein